MPQPFISETPVKVDPWMLSVQTSLSSTLPIHWWIHEELRIKSSVVTSDIINHRKLNIRVQMDFDHKRVQDKLGHDDRLVQSPFYDALHILPDHAIRPQCDDAFVDWL